MRQRPESAQEPSAEAPAAPPPGAAQDQGPPNPTAQLELALDQARRRIDELARAYQAVERDREEFKQRLVRERERVLEVEKAKVAVVLLEAIDELDLCLGATEPSALGRGVRLIRDGLLKKAQSLGLERVELLGQVFDPTLAEAGDVEVTGVEAEDQKVVSVLRAAWRLGERVVRPGKVKVARYVRPAKA